MLKLNQEVNLTSQNKEKMLAYLTLVQQNLNEVKFIISRL